MESFSSITATAVPFLRKNVDTDVIIPIQRLVGTGRTGLGPHAFERLRYLADGSDNPEFPLNRPEYKGSKLLLADENFGCGSSREGAVWTFLAVGITCIVARSIADLYRENCLQNGLLPIELADDRMDGLLARVRQADGREPFTVDLRTRTISGPGGGDIPFDISDADRTRLLEGLDDIGMSLKHEQAIAAWEERTRASAPWLQQPSRDPSRESAP